MLLKTDAGTVKGYPLPRAGSSYSVDDKCQLLKYNLTIDGLTGALKLVLASVKDLKNPYTGPLEMCCTCLLFALVESQRSMDAEQSGAGTLSSSDSFHISSCSLQKPLIGFLQLLMSFLAALWLCIQELCRKVHHHRPRGGESAGASWDLFHPCCGGQK